MTSSVAGSKSRRKGFKPIKAKHLVRCYDKEANRLDSLNRFRIYCGLAGWHDGICRLTQYRRHRVRKDDLKILVSFIFSPFIYYLTISLPLLGCIAATIVLLCAVKSEPTYSSHNRAFKINEILYLKSPFASSTRPADFLQLSSCLLYTSPSPRD